MATVDIVAFGAHGAPVVQIARLTARAPGATLPRVHIASLRGRGGPIPPGPPARVQIVSLLGRGGHSGPVPGRSLLHRWDGTNLRPVIPMIYNGTTLERT
ncbi:hypothetical protein [Occultella kanbiaonis]|uniref:hypothetical protein n=1 Tax=Occultella kanbiaonis TaxID=2675754 RepID=UPI0013D1EF5B|nr:hypothetical protein [Occultella kanbiaonis]